MSNETAPHILLKVKEDYLHKALQGMNVSEAIFRTLKNIWGNQKWTKSNLCKTAF